MQLDLLLHLLVRVVPEGNEVFLVRERDDASRILFGHRKQEAKDTLHLWGEMTSTPARVVVPHFLGMQQAIHR